jgi:hypothetical protein
VGDELAVTERTAGGQHRGDVAEHVVGHGEQQQVAGPGDVGGLGEGNAGEQRRGTVPGGVGLGRRRDDLVAGGSQRGGQHRTDTTGADDAGADV